MQECKILNKSCKICIYQFIPFHYQENVVNRRQHSFISYKAPMCKHLPLRQSSFFCKIDNSRTDCVRGSMLGSNWGASVIDIVFEIFNELYCTQPIQQLICQQLMATARKVINIRYNSNNPIAIEVDPKWDIRRLKQVISGRLRIPQQEVRIIFQGRELADIMRLEVCILK